MYDSVRMNVLDAFSYLQQLTNIGDVVKPLASDPLPAFVSHQFGRVYAPFSNRAMHRSS